MKWFLSFLLISGLWGANPELLKVKSVYLLPMASGLDQYLANALQTGGLYVVVTDPATADAVFTDSIGPAFERKWNDLYPPEKTEEDEEENPRTEAAAPASTFRRGRGVVFLVERKSKQVVWSTFAPARDARPSTIDKTAQTIATRLKKDLGGK
ncbi:MAG: hypothetical protein JNK48_08915 [Bryobacterales bacterium]|nr:hypothetical protein [Bryobacterales bacterium]